VCLDIVSTFLLPDLIYGLLLCEHKRADPVPEAPTRVGSGEGNNRSKVLPLGIIFYVQIDLFKHFREDVSLRLWNSDFKRQIDGIELLQKVGS
jgi:hypothetical protein